MESGKFHVPGLLGPTCFVPMRCFRSFILKPHVYGLKKGWAEAQRAVPKPNSQVDAQNGSGGALPSGTQVIVV